MFLLGLLKPVVVTTLEILILLLPHILLGSFTALLVAIRWMAIGGSKMLVRGAGKAFSTWDVMLLEDYNERHALSVVVMLTFDGDVSAYALQQQLERNVLAAELKEQQQGSSSSSKLQFLELQQVQDRFLGYPFWKKDPEFRVENHIHELVYDDAKKQASDHFASFESMVSELTGRAYPVGRSPWQMYVVRRFREAEEGEDGPSKTVIIWRAHHSLMDGFSILNVITKLFGMTTGPMSPPPSSQATALKQKSDGPRDWISSICSIPAYHTLLSQLSQNRRVKQWLLARRRNVGGAIMPGDKSHFRFAAKLPLDQVKGVAAKLGVRVPSLLVTLLMDAVSKVVNADEGGHFFHALYAMPLANHPETLANHTFLDILQFSLCGSVPVSDKLVSTNAAFLGLKSNPISQYLNFIMGNCPPAVCRSLVQNLLYSPLAISNFSAGCAPFRCGGLDCAELKGGFGVPMGWTDSVSTILGYKNHVRILFGAHDSVFSVEDVDRIASGIGESFGSLLSHASISMQT